MQSSDSPSLDRANQESKSTFVCFLQGLPASKWFWFVAGLLFVGNLLLLLFSGPNVDPEQLGNELEQETQAFERLSVWERLLQGSNGKELSFSAFDGQPIDPDYEESVVSVMIDNFSLARPQHSGIRSASLVYEALVEGGITRLMLVFPYQELNKVGPVRSARDYFVDLSEEYGGLYVHAGGSPTALNQLWASDRVYSIEEDEREETDEPYSFRDPDYDAPHDLFFDLLLTRERAENLEYDLQAPRQSWCFIRDEADEDQNAASFPALTAGEVSRIEIDFSNDPSSSYYVQFDYDEQQNTYKRFYGNTIRTPHIDDKESLQVSPTNLIIQFVPSHLIEGDEKERIELDDVGTGTAWYYMKGKKYEGTWSKVSSSSPTQFLHSDGDPLCVQAGQSWVALVDRESLVSEQ